MLLGGFLLYTGIAIYSQQCNIDALTAEQDMLIQEYTQVQTEYERLEHTSDYMNTDDYVEDAAREKFGLVYPDEIILVPE